MDTCRRDPEEEFIRAKLSAAGSLHLRMHCRQELKTKLLDKGHREEIVEQALDYMEELVKPSWCTRAKMTSAIADLILLCVFYRGTDGLHSCCCQSCCPRCTKR